MSYADFMVQDNAIEKIVTKHCNDFTYENYSTVIKKAGGYNAYIKSLGGIFAKWADFKGTVKTVDEFAECMNYVWGLYRIWGTDYSNGCSYDYDDNKWKARCGHYDAFYPTESPSKRFNMNYGAYGFGSGTDLPTVDAMLSNSKYYAVTNCGQGVLQSFKKAGLCPADFPDPSEYPQYWKDHGYGYKIIKNASDLQVGDVLIFTKKRIPNRDSITNIPNWIDSFFHTAIVGKRDSNYIYMFDSGHAFTYYGEPINRRKIGDNTVYQWAADWIALRYDVVSNLTKKFTGWKKEGGKWYYIEADKKATGWRKLAWSGGTNWFYFDQSGVMQTGWKKLTWSKGENWFYFEGSGAMVTGWKEITYKGKKQWFYFNSDGAMLTGTHCLKWKGKYGWYIFDKDGVLQEGKKVKVRAKFGSHGLEGGTML